MENTSSLNGFSHGIEQWVRQMERLTPLPSVERNQLLEQLLGQSDLGGLLTTFADRAARIVRIHGLYLDCGQPHVLIQHPPLATLNLHNYPFELRGQHGQLLGQLHYELEHPLSGSQQRVLMQYHQLLCLLLPLPFAMDMYQVNVMASAFIWIMLGLGLNIVVGQAGLLVLGYVAFYAVGAYAYAIVNIHFGNDFIGFWIMLPIGGLLAALAGILLSLPVLRLRGDYLAIVTLGFGEIVRVFLEGGSVSLAPVASFISLFTDAALPAWMTTPLEFGGPAGISNIPYPGFFGMKLSMDSSIRFVYYIALALVVLTMIAVARLRDSRLGRSWIALREDEIACEAMGINKVSAKLSAFALGACWAGFGGVLFAAKTTFINPTSFTFMESALILSVVVLGGLGSILGVALGACILILLPEYLRSFNEYRMLIFGASMVLMMVFRPQGLITPKAKKRVIAGVNDQTLREAGFLRKSGAES